MNLKINIAPFQFGYSTKFQQKKKEDCTWQSPFSSNYQIYSIYFDLETSIIK